MRFNYKHTRVACYISFIALAVPIGLTPLLFTTFNREFSIDLGGIAALISSVFLINAVVIGITSCVAEKVGYRRLAVIMHVLSAAGLVGLGVFPYIFPSPFSGLIVAIVLYSIGNGIIDTIINPILESLPAEHKDAELSLLHSVFCWGQVIVIVFSILYQVQFGMSKWYILPIIWTVFPIVNIFLFTKVPLKPIIKQEGKIPFRWLLSKKIFLLLVLLIFCAGPVESCMSQWASMFAEDGLGVSKSTGDILGPCAFALLTGISRLMYGLKGANINLEKTMFAGGIGCFLSYMLVVFSPIPVLSLAGCGLTGFFVGVLWPGAISLAAKEFPKGGTAMFGVLSLAGCFGASIGNAMVGVISKTVQDQRGWAAALFPNSSSVGMGLKAGLLVISLFSIIVTICIGGYIMHGKKRENKVLSGNYRA